MITIIFTDNPYDQGLFKMAKNNTITLEVYLNSSFDILFQGQIK
jgi:hypothetical protein